VGLLERLGPEFRVLRDSPLDEIERAGTSAIREAVSRMRAGTVSIVPGYDGEYGKIELFREAVHAPHAGQIQLF